ncbi:MAG: response regulator transcription factor [bacterium]
MTKRILVADDDNDIREMLITLLTDFGYETISAKDGKQAEEKIKSEVFDLAILDVSMPFTNGYHLCYQITTQTDRKPAKVIIITARDPEKDKMIGTVSGAEVYITKPFEYKELLKKVTELIGKP